jgi:glycosyltransferase involved in cell wall biosynthesis
MPTCLLDLTRLVSRLGQGPLTGIDRVEAAWAENLIARTDPVMALVRTGLGFLILERGGMVRLLDHLRRDLPLPEPDWLSRLRLRGSGTTVRAESLARRLARHRVSRPLLRLSLRRLFPGGGVYLNLGHANLTDQVLRAIGRAGLTRVVMIHDTIPLDFPQFTRPAVVEGFAAKLAAVARGADLVVHLARATKITTEAHLARFGQVPPGVIAPLAVPAPVPAFDHIAGLCPDGPYFVALGTIEPRKNTRFLLDVWEGLPNPRPALLLLGRQGWEEDSVLARAKSQDGVRILSGLNDGQTAAILSGARALLFPSFAEGFGLPPVEAARLGVPVLAHPLPVLQETLGDYPIYLDQNDIYSWTETIKALVIDVVRPKKGAPEGRASAVATVWDDHVKCVFAGLRQIGPKGQGDGQEK